MFPPDETAEIQPPKLVTTEPLESSPSDSADAYDPDGDSPWADDGLIDERYHLERRLGGGAMGEVWLAGDRLLKKSVALKVLRPDLAKNRATVRRFLQEVALAQSVTHPHVVRIHDTGEAFGLPYFTMELLQGQTMDQLVGRHGEMPNSDTPPMTMREIRELGIEILDALEAAHRAGVIHRDLKPANVMLTHRGAILMDFGVAGVEAFPGLTKKQSPNPTEARSLIHTEAGTIFGSPAYMAPELWEGASATVHSDLYSFGVMLYQMLSGRLPYDAPNASAFLEKLRTETPIPVKSLRKNTPWRLAAAVARCMARAPEERPGTAQTVADLITPLAKRRGLLLGGAVSLVALGGAITAAYQVQPSYAEHGLPDEIAEADLNAAIRLWDVGDYTSAKLQLDRLSTRAPRSAAVTFWQASIARELKDHEERLSICLPDDDPNPVWEGSAEWIDLADSACGSTYTLGTALLGTLGRKAGSFGDAYLPMAVQRSLIPQVEVGADQSGAVTREAEAVLDRLNAGPRFSDGPFVPVRWELARIDLNVALGRLDMARELVDRGLDFYPDAPILEAHAAWLYARLGESDRASVWAYDVDSSDPRPVARLLLEQGRLAETWAMVEEAEEGPYHAALVDMWCGYAFRFELEQAPAQCSALGPGLVRTLWGRSEGRGTDGATMTPRERTVTAAQAGLNLGECLERVEPGPVLTHASPPFETYLMQLQISAAICGHSPTHSVLPTARRLLEKLTAVAPEDPWSMLLAAQLAAASGSATLSESKRRIVAETWADADAGLPLVSRLRGSLGLAQLEPRQPKQVPPAEPSPAQDGEAPQPALDPPPPVEDDAGGEEPVPDAPADTQGQ